VSGRKKPEYITDKEMELLGHTTHQTQVLKTAETVVVTYMMGLRKFSERIVKELDK
jgi:hypothetical protein